jgi:hypothetical protein
MGRKESKMTLENNDILGTVFPIQISLIVKKSNAVWGAGPLHRASIEGQMTLALYTYLGGLHADGKAPTVLTEAVVQLLHRYGLPKYLKATSELYDLLVREGSFDFPEPSQEMIEILPGDPNWLSFCRSFGNWRSDAMQKAWALRFLKRFTVKGADLLYKQCLSDFVATDNRNKDIDRLDNSIVNGLKSRIKDLARSYLGYALKGFSPDNVLNAVMSMDFDPTPNGVNNCCTDPRHRVGRVLAYLGYLPSNSDCIFFPGLLGIDLQDRTVVNVTAVPKDYKSYRIVSPDDPINLAFQQAIVNEINRCLEKNGLKDSLPLHDQEIMRALTFASTNGGRNYATIDQSRASDTVRLSLARDLFPSEVMELIDRFRPTKYNVAGTNIHNHTLYMLAPMGSAFTLLLESLIFWAIDSASCHICAIYTSSKRNLGEYRIFKHKKVIYPFCCKAMGDDQQVPQEYAEFCIEVLTAFGFVVNVSKSFFDPLATFRESCGAESLNGEPIDGFYFPRHDLHVSMPKGASTIRDLYDLDLVADDFWNDRDRSGNVVVNSTTTAIIAMSKTLLLLGYTNIANRLQRWIASKIPGMTFSEVGTPASDLWAEQDIVRHYEPLPLGQFVDLAGLVRNPFFPVLEQEVPIRVLEVLKPTDPLAMRPVHWSISSKKEKLAPVVTLYPHTCPVCRWLRKSPIYAYVFNNAIEVYRYTRWLRKGPNYQSELDRLLRVTAPTPEMDVITSPVVGRTF